MPDRSSAETATILFTDLVGSTALRARLGEERADELRRVHDALLGAAAADHGGNVVKSTGDGLMVVFTSATDALSCAVEMQRCVAAYTARRDAIAALSIRVGLSTGDVGWDGGDCFGTPVIEAARLEAAAAGGQILCSDLVRMMSRGRGGHEFRMLGLLDLKGLPEPVPVSEVVWVPAVADTPSVPLPPDLSSEGARPFVSRGAQLGSAHDLLVDAGRSRAAVLWVFGEPGIGKTRLATELAQRAHAEGAVVLFGRCSEDLTVPYQPFLESLRRFAGQLDADALPARLGEHPGDLTRLVPELGPRLGGLEPSRSTMPELVEHQLFEAVRTWLGTAGGDRPVVAVLDDLHWASKATLALLAHVAGSAEPSRALFVCTARSTVPDVNPALTALVEDLGRRGTPSRRFDLQGLDVAGVGALVESVTGQDLDDASRALAFDLHRDTGGLPLFLDALLAQLPADGGPRPQTLPGTLTETLTRRVGRLPTETAELLRLASVAGLDLDVRVLARVAGKDEIDVVDLLEVAAGAGLVLEVAADRYRFAHALVRSALRDTVSRSRRVRLHLRIGEAIEEMYAGDDEHVAELAHHFAEAVPLGGAAKAYAYAVRTAQRATRLLSPSEAAVAYGEALRLLALLPDGEATARCELLLARGEAQFQAGDMWGGIGTLRTAADEAERAGSADQLARAAIALDHVTSMIGQDGTETLRILERAEVALAGVESPLRVVVLAARSRALTFVGRWPEAMALGEEATELARRLGDPATLAEVLVRRAWAYRRHPRHARDLAAVSGELVELADTLDNDEHFAQGASAFVLARATLGDLGPWDAFMADPVRIPRFMRHAYYAHALTIRGQVRAVLAGDLPAAQELLARAEEIATRHSWGVDGLYGLAGYLLRREQGTLPALAPALRTLVRLRPDGGLWGPGLASLYTELGLLDEARAELERFTADDLAAVPVDDTRLLCIGLLAEVCAAVGDAPVARRLTEELLSCRGLLMIVIGMGACLGPADRLLGLLASCTGDEAGAAAYFRSAIAFARALPSPLWTAHCLYDAGVRLDPSCPEAVAMLTEAAELADAHGLVTLAGRTRGRLTAQRP